MELTVSHSKSGRILHEGIYNRSQTLILASSDLYLIVVKFTLYEFGKITVLFPNAYHNHTWRSVMGLGSVVVTAHQFSVMPYRKLETLIYANQETMGSSVDKQRLRFCRRCIILKHGANNTSFEVRTDWT